MENQPPSQVTATDMVEPSKVQPVSNVAVVNSESGHSTPPVNEPSPRPPRKTAKWKINWFGEPLQIYLYPIVGLGLALGHHFLYLGLDGRIESERQLGQLAVKQAGNFFAFMVLAVCKIAIEQSFSQYVWLLLHGEAFKIRAIERLFTLCTDYWAFLEFQILRRGKVAALLALCAW
jgi:hypothetical protein